MPEPSQEAVERLLLDEEVAASVERIRRAVDSETLDEAVSDLIHVITADLRAKYEEEIERLKVLNKEYEDTARSKTALTICAENADMRIRLRKAEAEVEKLREAVRPFIQKHVACLCTWDLDEDHPDFGVEEAEEPLKVVRSNPDCPLHTILATLDQEAL